MGVEMDEGLGSAVTSEVKPEAKNEGFVFTGKASEYFSIWIVNVVLTIVTLGIYSAWAKVRTNQYFYGNTLLDGVSFRYLASPIQILKGRIIAFAIFVAYYFASLVNPIFAGVAMLIIMLLVPAFIVMSMSFRLRNSAYRNVRFGFKKDFKRAYTVFMLPLLFVGAYLFSIIQLADVQAANPGAAPEFPVFALAMMLAIFLMFPWWEFLVTQFKVVYARFGDADFTFSAVIKSYYGMYLKMFVVGSVAFGAIGFAFAVLLPMVISKDDPVVVGFIVPGVMLLALPVYLWIFAYLQTRRTNLVFDNLHIGGHRVRAELKTGYMMYLYVTNTLAIVLSLGLMMPWAKVRTAAYKASVISVDVTEDLGQFVAAQVEHQSAIGEEIGDMFDMDLGVGF